MITWITENAATIIASSVILVLVGIAVFSIVNGKKNKKGGCTGNCHACGTGCPCGDKKK